MAQENDFFGKSFDQQILATGGEIDNLNLTPNRRIPGEIVFEPMGSAVRVTARDKEHRVLWGYVGSKETLHQIHCLVATYETLQSLVGEELEKRGLLSVEGKDPMVSAQSAFDGLEKTLKWLRESINVNKISPATLERARTLARIVADADRQMSLEAGTLKGMKSKTDQSGG